MSFPSLPFDSLYKFLAVFGLMSWIFIFVAGLKSVKGLRIRQAKNQAEWQNIRTELCILMEAVGKEGQNEAKDAKFEEYAWKRTAQLQDEVKNLNTDINLLEANLRTEEYRQKVLRPISLLATAMMTIGFVGWAAGW